MKYVYSVLLVIVLVFSIASVSIASTAISNSKIETIKQMLIAFNVDETSINSIMNILQSGDGCGNNNMYSSTTGKKCIKPVFTNIINPPKTNPAINSNCNSIACHTATP